MTALTCPDRCGLCNKKRSVRLYLLLVKELNKFDDLDYVGERKKEGLVYVAKWLCKKCGKEAKNKAEWINY